MTNFIKEVIHLFGILKSIIWILGLSFVIFALLKQNPDYFNEEEIESSEEFVVNASEILKPGEGLEIVIQNCTACHSARLIDQNKATREGWLSMIRWMQANQNLWDLGENEEVILNYLSENYPPESSGRRTNLANIEWYDLEPN